MPKTTILPLLASGDFCSGQALAAALGVSRTAVWKQLNALSGLGLQIESVKGRGYRIPGGLDLLDAARVRASLTPAAAALLAQLDLHETLDSTNAESMRQMDSGAAAGLACSAEQQSAGRGRRGRSWVSPFARNIYLSVAWRYHQGAAVLEGLSLAVGVAVARALAASGVPPVQLKWPNDVVHQGAKLGGVLLEMTGDASGACQVVAGVGLNVAMPEAAAGAIDQAWTDVETLCGGKHPGRNALLAALLNELLPLLASFEDSGFAPWRDEWLALDAFAGAPVLLHTGAQDMAGIARGVDERGALQLETAGAGLQSIHGGEISHAARAMKLADNCLQLDVGNSSSKWRLLERGRVIARGSYRAGDESSRAELLGCAAQLQQIWVSSVAGPEAELELSRMLQQRWGITPWFGRSTANCGAVRNSYTEPARMGVDRWLAMLAAWERVQGRVCVVDAGSALTIDLVDGSGVHQGGYILPGASLMERALLEDTGRVRFAQEVEHALTPGTSTAEAVRHGIAVAQAGALAMVMDREGIEPRQLLVCGGWGETLMQLLDRGGQFVPDLVFEGLPVLAADSD